MFRFVEKRNNSQLDLLVETTIEEQLSAENISYISLPKEETKGAYLSGKKKVFLKEELSKFEAFQQITVIDSTVIQSVFREPILIQDINNRQARMDQIIKDQVLNGDQYTFWRFDEMTRTMIYFQKFGDKTIYGNISGTLLVRLNELNEVISYEQTMLEDLQTYEEQQEILTSLKAIESLYKKNELKPGNKVTNVQLGYYSLVQLTSSQVLAPTWHIVVDQQQDFFVNAMEGNIISREK